MRDSYICVNYVSGKIFDGDGFVEGFIGFDEGVIQEIGKGSPKKKPRARGIVIPTFTNAHTHIGDAIARDRLTGGTIEELVAPPNGLKHRVLRESAPEDLIAAMKSALTDMLQSGTSVFYDFRESGLAGIAQLNQALAGSPLKPVILGRPKNMVYDRSELDDILDKADGIGLSSISDWHEAEIKKIARHTRERKKLFAIHASERVRENIENVLDLHPDFLVHMLHATDEDLRIVSEAHVPVVVCPRSNAFFGMIPNIPRMLKQRVRVFLGTDNLMLASPDVFREMEFAYRTSRMFGEAHETTVSPSEIYAMTFFNAEKKERVRASPAGVRTPFKQGAPVDFIVLSRDSTNPMKTVVCDASPRDIALIAVGTFLWMPDMAKRRK